MADVRFDGVRKVYDNGRVAVHGASFDIADGELMVLVGPSGCGKSTLLRMVAGLEETSAGTLSIGGRVVNDVAPKDRDIAMVFQNYALYPHMTVAENLAFGLKLRGHDKAEIARRVQGAADMLGLGGMLGTLPRAMSGGQRQRVALGRALVREPAVFGAGAGARAGGVPAGRAAVQSRCQAAALGAHRDRAPAPQAGHDDDLRHP